MSKISYLKDNRLPSGYKKVQSAKPQLSSQPWHLISPAAPSKPPVAVEVIDLKVREDKGALRAFASVRIAGKITIKDFRVIQVAGQKAFVSPPQREFKGPLGEKT